MSRADIYGVIVALVDEITSQLADGKIVVIGKLGQLELQEQIKSTPHHLQTQAH